MDISYNNYPFIGFPQSVLLNESGTFPFQLPSTNTKNQNFSFKRFVLNSIEKFSKGIIPSIYYISLDTWQKIEEDASFRESCITDFLSNEIQTTSGNILLDNGKMFIYLSLSEEDTLLHFNLDGNYVGVACLTCELLEGFEEVIVSEQGIKKGVSFYTNNQFGKGISSFIMACLAISRNSTKQVSTPRISEKVVFV